MLGLISFAKDRSEERRLISEMSLALIKLGGGLIAPKDWPAHTADVKTIRRLGEEIKEFAGSLIIGHGGGNFPHTEATKYKTYEGFRDEKGKLRACLTQVAARDINSIVMREFLSLGLPVASVAPHDIGVASNGKVTKEFYEPIKLLLKKRMIPVVYGDVIWDIKRGCTIFSTEVWLSLLARHFKSVKRIIQVTAEKGVLGSEGKIIKVINSRNFTQLKSAIGKAAGVDVTGGMLDKVEESLKLAKDMGIETLIISGKVAGRLAAALRGEKVDGTRIG